VLVNTWRSFITASCMVRRVRLGHSVAILAPSVWHCCNIYLSSPWQHLSDGLNVFREDACYSDMRHVLFSACVGTYLLVIYYSSSAFDW
jgi:hypothetical protein